MHALEQLFLGGSDLCAPKFTTVAEWLERISFVDVDFCETEEDGTSSVARAYLTQAVQSTTQPVPLIAGRKALLRVFLTVGKNTPSTGENKKRSPSAPTWPDVRATFFVDGAQIYATGPFSAEVAKIPEEIAEHDTQLSANVEIPGSVIRPGLAMSVEIDLAGADESWLCCERIPQQGRQTVDVRAVPPVHLVVLPLLDYADPDSSLLGAIRDIDPGHDLFADLLSLAPVGELSLEVREPVWTTSANQAQWLREIEAMRVVEGHGVGTYFMGLASNIPRSVGGLAYIPGKATLSLPDAQLIAHELMHNFSLRHAPCFKDDIDDGYPRTRGTIGSVGYDFRTGSAVSANTFDLMGNIETCLPVWISGYHFRKALRFRLTTDAVSTAHAAPRRPGRSATAAPGLPGQVLSSSPTNLLVWGGRAPDGEPFLEPAFVVNAPASIPFGHGAYEIVGTGPDGQVLFSRRFDMQTVADGNGTADFAFVVPAEPEWANELAVLTLVGPGGSATIDQDGDGPTAVLLRDHRSGHVKGILRNWTEGPQVAPELAVRVSAGVPSPASWRR